MTSGGHLCNPFKTFVCQSSHKPPNHMCTCDPPSTFLRLLTGCLGDDLLPAWTPRSRVRTGMLVSLLPEVLWGRSADPVPMSFDEANNITTCSYSHLFLRTRKNSLFFCSCGATPSRTVPKTQPLQVTFSLLEIRFEVPERGDLGEENWLWKGGVDGAKKGRKDAQKKVGTLGSDTC